MLLFCVRHGDPIYDQDSLTPLGHRQAQAVSKWEQGRSCPDIAILDEIADALGISLFELLGMEERNKSSS